MKKKWEVRYFVTAVASVPVCKAYSKTETYRQAAKDGWGTVYRDENNVLVCDEDCAADLYTKNGGYFGIRAYEEIATKEMPKQAECAAIIVSDSCGFTFWAEQEQSILILRLVLDLTDGEIGEALGLSRSAVQRRRTKSLNVLRTKLTARKGG